MTETTEDGGSVGPCPRKSDGANGARYEHSALARRKYNLLASKETEGFQANAGAAGSKDGHGAMANRVGTETEEEWDKNPHQQLRKLGIIMFAT